MLSNFRLSMTWLHTWFGLVLGFVLIVVFFFGSLSVFDREIDRWAIPETRFEPQPMPSFDRMLLPLLQRVEPDSLDYAANMPLLHDAQQGPMTPRLELPADEYWAYTTHRDPVLAMGVGFRVPQPKDPQGHNHIHGDTTIDPRNGQALREGQQKIGSEFFYPLHYSLHLEWKLIGFWVVALAALSMLAMLVTGLVMHRKLLAELFTFRRAKHLRRSLLDLHNLTGVVALPFHFFFAFTGLVIFAQFYYLPVSQTMLRPLAQAHEVAEAAATGLPHERAGVAASLASVDAMVVEAQRRWDARGMPGQVGFLQVHHVGDANSYVSIYRAGSDRVALVGQAVHFKGSTGEVLREEPASTVPHGIEEFLTGLHLQHFEHWLLRWLYVFGGLLGCACIATGFLFFVEKRKRQHAQQGRVGSRVVDALAVSTVTGMLIATAAILIANRVLPAELAFKGDWERLVFWGAWALATLHAFWRGAPVAQGARSPAWREQCRGFAVLALLAVLLNWTSTGDHLGKTLFAYWPVAGVDLALIAAAGLAWWAANRLSRRERALAPQAPGSTSPEETARV
jgi:uncharacterized iron-regulated membrane protein